MKVEVVDEIASNEDTVSETLAPAPDGEWAAPAAGVALPPPGPRVVPPLSPPPGGRWTPGAVEPAGAPPPPAPRIAPPPPAAPRARRWGLPLALLGALLLVFVAVATWIPTDRYGIAPGSARAVEPRVDLSAKTFPSKGQILFVTVGIPKLSVLGRIVGAIDPDVEVKTAREVFGDQTQEQNQVANLKLMSYSKETAAYVAMVTSTSPNAKQANRVRVRTAGGPEVWERSEKARTANTAYRAIVGSSRPYRHP